MEYETEFPKQENKYLKASVFQDQDIPLTFKGWKKKTNEDVTKKDGSKISWKQRVKYQLRYSYPEWAMDKDTGEKLLDKENKPFKNKHWDSAYPQGYSIVYAFEEGILESGSLPLFNAFCLVRPNPGDMITVRRDGTDQETKWTVKRCNKATIHASTAEKQSNDEPDWASPEYSNEEIPDEIA